MDIEKRILDLLYFKDCVIIPGLGGFVSHYIPAKIREETQTFIPPAKKIGFNRDLLHDDSLLSGYLADCENISNIEARKAIDKFVDNLKGKIVSGASYSLDYIGAFSYTKTGELHFSSSREINFLSDSFGLKSFHFTRAEIRSEHPLLQRTVRKRDSKEAIRLPGTSNKVKDKSLRRAAIAIPLLLAVSLLPVNTRNGFNNGQQSATLFPFPAVTGVEQPINTNPSDISDKQNQDSANPYDVNADSEKDENSLIKVPFDRNSFAIVAGSFSTERNAGVLQEELIDKGFQAEIWEAANGFHRVVIQAHESMSIAQEAIVKLRENLKNIDFWILQ